jgi:Holliday junction DNA helicase RuvA
MVAREDPRGPEAEADRDVMRETFDALRSLGHSEHDARRLIEAALEGKKKFKTVEEMLQAIYQQSHKK